MKKQPENSLLADIKDGKNGRFWLALRQIIEDEMIDLEAQILEDETLTEQVRNDLRKWRNFLKYFTSLPEKLIDSIEAGKTEPLEFDPYATITKEIKNNY